MEPDGSLWISARGCRRLNFEIRADHGTISVGGSYFCCGGVPCFFVFLDAVDNMAIGH